jgi:mannitol-1-/sugar-/sorbitol-6-/2-deoxyglucose-6-phosphatase
MSRAAIFDMDGVLINSEPLWWRAGVEVLRGVDVHLGDHHFRETMGLRTDVALAHWYKRYPWAGKSLQQLEQEVKDRVLSLISDEGHALPGVHALIRFLSEQRIPIGLCSSSPYQVIHAVLDRLGIRQNFQVVHSAEDEPVGKPHPGAYLSCAARLGVPAPRCIAFEDSVAGAVSAKAARMKVIAVLQGVPSTAFDFCEVRLNTLIDFTPALFNQLLPT